MLDFPAAGETSLWGKAMSARTLLRLAGAVILVAGGLGFTTTAQAGNGMRDTGATIRQISRGGAFIATDPDAGALSGNPAALAFLEEPQFDFELRMIDSTLKYRGALNGRGVSRQFWAPGLAYAEPATCDFAWGLGVFSLSNMGYGLQDLDLSVVGAPPGTFDDASSAVRYLAVTPGVAWRLSDDTAIGASLHWSSGETADQSYSILANTSGTQLSGLAGHGYAWRAGLLHRCDEDTQLGLYYRSKSNLKVSGGTLKLAPGNPAGAQTIENVTVEGAEFPEEYGVGIQHRFDCHFKATAEWRHIGWSAVRDNFVIQPPGLAPIVFPQNWTDQNVYVLGAEFAPQGEDGSVWRAGLNYARSPIPDATLSPIFAATNELHYSLGYEQRLSDEWSMLGGVSYSPANLQTSTAANPYNATFGAGQPFSAGASQWEVGLGFSWSPRHKHSAAPCESCGHAPCCCEESDPSDQAGVASETEATAEAEQN